MHYRTNSTLRWFRSFIFPSQLKTARQLSIGDGAASRSALVVVGDGAVSDSTSGLGPRFGQDDAVALLVRVGGEQVHAENDLGELERTTGDT